MPVVAFKNGQVLFVGGQASFGVNCCCGSCVSVCDCCYSPGTRFSFTMPPLTRGATASCPAPLEIDATVLADFLAWLNGRTFTSPELFHDPDDPFLLYSSARNISDTFASGGNEWSVHGSVLWQCTSGGFSASVVLTFEHGMFVHSCIVSLEWAADNCCRATAGPATLDDLSEDWCGWVRDDTEDYAFVVLGNTCCVDALGACADTGAATCGGTDTGDCPEEPI